MSNIWLPDIKIGLRGTDFFFFSDCAELVLGLCLMAIFGFMVLNLRSLLVYMLCVSDLKFYGQCIKNTVKKYYVTLCQICITVFRI
jgi:hypothetical protein